MVGIRLFYPVVQRRSDATSQNAVRNGSPPASCSQSLHLTFMGSKLVAPRKLCAARAVRRPQFYNLEKGVAAGLAVWTFLSSV